MNDLGHYPSKGKKAAPSSLRISRLTTRSMPWPGETTPAPLRPEVSLMVLMGIVCSFAEDGSVFDVRASESSPFAVAAVDAVEDLRIEHALRDGRPIASERTSRFVFRPEP